MLYDPIGNALTTSPAIVAPGSAATACFDSANNIAFSFTSNQIEVDYNGLPSNNVYMMECSEDIFEEAAAAGVPLYTLPAPPMLRALTRVNSDSHMAAGFPTPLGE